MSYSKLIISLLTVAVGSNSVIASPILTEEDMAGLNHSKELMEKARKLDSPDWLRQYDPSSSVQNTEEGVKRWIPAAQQIGDDTNDFVKKTISNIYGIEGGDKNNIRTIDMDVRSDSPMEKGEELYYFISFSQPEFEIKEILKAASKVDARVILRGMRPEDKMVNYTAMAIAKLAKGITPLPKVSMDPRLHKTFNINSAPSMVYRKGNHVVTAEGVASVNWFLEKARGSDQENLYLGKISDTREITEKDVIEEIQSRAAAVDWDAKRRKAMNNYISKLPNFNIPTAQKDSKYKIDPRVQFNKDVEAKDGSLLASKGQVVNPLDHFPGQGMTLYIFDGTSAPQKALVKKEMKTADGEIWLMTSRIDKEEGFQFIAELNKEYQRQVFVLQQRIIERFQIRNLPAEVYLGNGEIVIREFGIKTQEDAWYEAKNRPLNDEVRLTTDNKNS